MSKEKLREMLDATINEDTATAEAAFHAYSTDKFRVIMEEMDDEKEPDADDIEDKDSDEDDFEDKESDEDDSDEDDSDEDDSDEDDSDERDDADFK